MCCWFVADCLVIAVVCCSCCAEIVCDICSVHFFSLLYVVALASLIVCVCMGGAPFVVFAF